MEYIIGENKIHAESETGELLCEVTFPARDALRVDINHVFVDESLRGQGIASHLMEIAYETIKSRNLQIVAKCPYAISWFKKHPKFQDIVINVKTKEV